MGERKVSKSAPFLSGLARITLALCSRLPFGRVQALGRTLGRLLAVLPSSPRRVARANLARCYPDVAPPERRRLLRASLISAGTAVLESGPIWNWPAERLRQLEDGVDGEELLHRAMGAGRGTLLLLPHLGNWEMFNHFLMARYPFAALYRQPRIAQVERWLRRARSRLGAGMLPATPAGLRQVYRALGDGRLLVVLPDQEPVQSSGVYAPFFGFPALTMTLVARLLRRFHSPALLGYALRTGRGRFRYYFRQAPPGLDDRDPIEAATRLNAAVESCVRACPEQYMWAYKRFKTQPDEGMPVRPSSVLSRAAS